MINLAQKLNRPEVWLSLGDVADKKQNVFLVDTEDGRVAAERAEGCLIQPAVGDRVLLMCTDREAYILNVLTRKRPDRAAPVYIKGDADLLVGGVLNLKAFKVNLDGAESIRMKTSRFSLSFLKGWTGFGEFTWQGGLMQGRMESLKTVVNKLETRADRVMDKFKRHYRRVEELEDSRIGRLVCRVKDSFSLHSKSTSLKSRKQVTVDAEKIHLG